MKSARNIFFPLFFIILFSSYSLLTVSCSPDMLSEQTNEHRAEKKQPREGHKESEHGEKLPEIDEASMEDASIEMVDENTNSTKDDGSTEQFPENNPEESQQQPCNNNATRKCPYSGDKSKQGIGTCTVATQVCVGQVWSQCKGEILPSKERCDGKDNDCDGQTDEDFQQLGQECLVGVGECANKGTYVCSKDGLSSECNVSEKPKKAEECNGKDDDCNGKIDDKIEKVGKECEDASKKGACKKGTYICDKTKFLLCKTSVATTEVCDEIDNNCDGIVDNIAEKGKECSVTGQKGECAKGSYTCEQKKKVCKQTNQATTEVCNEKDDDCNGKIDDIKDDGKACSTSLLGVCKAGTWKCVQSQKTCIATFQASTESCNGKDNDCDGKVDNIAEQGKECSVPGQKGECGKGSYACKQGKKVCEQKHQASTEVCNDKDDDCDGQTDEDFSTKGNPCNVGTGQCANSGKQVCSTDGKTTECSARVKAASNEICDNKDNDCDGKVDEDLDCPWMQIYHRSGFRIEVEAIALDKDDSIYTAGVIPTGKSFAIASQSILSSKDFQGYLVKKDKVGKVQWSVFFICTQGGITMKKIATDSQKNVYLLGQYNGSKLQVGNLTILGKQFATSSFLVKFDNNGKLVWLKRLGTENSKMGSVVIDSYDKLYVTGAFHGKISLNFKTYDTGNGKNDGIVMKLKSDGTFEWIKTFGGSDSDSISHITLDANQDIYVGGGTSSSDLKVGSKTHKALGSYDALYIKLNPSGTVLSSGTFGGKATFTTVTSMATDTIGHIYFFISSSNYDWSVSSGKVVLTRASVFTQTDSIIIKQNSIGEAKWLVQTKGTKNESAGKLIMGKDGLLFGTLNTNSDISLQSQTYKNQGGSDIVYFKLDSQGKMKWLKGFGGVGTEGLTAIAEDSRGNLYLIGYFIDGEVKIGTSTIWKSSYAIGACIKLDSNGKAF